MDLYLIHLSCLLLEVTWFKLFAHGPRDQPQPASLEQSALQSAKSNWKDWHAQLASALQPLHVLCGTFNFVVTKLYFHGPKFKPTTSLLRQRRHYGIAEGSFTAKNAVGIQNMDTEHNLQPALFYQHYRPRSFPNGLDLRSMLGNRWTLGWCFGRSVDFRNPRNFACSLEMLPS